MTTQTITILGATGSVGTQTLDVIRAAGPDRFSVQALTAAHNIALLAQQAREFNPACVAVADPALYSPLKALLADRPAIMVMAGADAINDLAGQRVDMTMAAITGIAGLQPVMQAVAHSHTVCFASKECLVAAGPQVMQAVAAAGCRFLPVDSEHNALFQVWQGARLADIERVTLTASGGPFRTMSATDMSRVTVAQALAHPTWRMGNKISIDSATLMNKALEVIEAHYLFHLPSGKIDVVVHPQSIVHGLVSYVDGSVLAQLGPADMRTPISYCLGYPARIVSPGARLDVTALGSLQFEPVDQDKFPAMRLVRSVLEAGQADQVLFNAANEIAVHAFLQGHIGFMDIVKIVEWAVDHGPKNAISSLADVIALDRIGRDMVQGHWLQAA